jgi:hypothetical protein
VVATIKKIEGKVSCKEVTVNLKTENGKYTRRRRNKFVL